MLLPPFPRLRKYFRRQHDIAVLTPLRLHDMDDRQYTPRETLPRLPRLRIGFPADKVCRQLIDSGAAYRKQVRLSAYGKLGANLL